MLNTYPELWQVRMPARSQRRTGRAACRSPDLLDQDLRNHRHRPLQRHLARLTGDLLNVPLDAARLRVFLAATVRLCLEAALWRVLLAAVDRGIGIAPLVLDRGRGGDGSKGAGDWDDVGGHGRTSFFAFRQKVGPGSGARKSMQSDGAGGPLDRAGDVPFKLLRRSNSARGTQRNTA